MQRSQVSLRIEGTNSLNTWRKKKTSLKSKNKDLSTNNPEIGNLNTPDNRNNIIKSHNTAHNILNTSRVLLITHSASKIHSLAATETRDMQHNNSNDPRDLSKDSLNKAGTNNNQRNNIMKNLRGSLVGRGSNRIHSDLIHSGTSSVDGDLIFIIVIHVRIDPSQPPHLVTLEIHDVIVHGQVQQSDRRVKVVPKGNTKYPYDVPSQ